MLFYGNTIGLETSLRLIPLANKFNTFTEAYFKMKENSSAQPHSAASGQVPEFYVVSKKKFFILFFGTAGLYDFYWFYRNWRLYKNSTGSQLWPIPRTIFGIFFIHSLFGLIKEKIVTKNSSFQWNHRSNATVLVILSLISKLLNRLAIESTGFPYIDILLTVMSLAILLPLASSLYQAQVAINYSCDDPEGTANHKITGANYCWIALGGCLWAVSITSILQGVVSLIMGNSSF